jgi:hypothetical protein
VTTPVTVAGITFNPAPLFPEKPYAITLTPDHRLQELLANNVKTLITYARHGAKRPTPRQQVAFTLILMAKDGNHRYAGVLDDALCYSASLLKVGVMYAAYEYRAAANRFLQANTIDPARPDADFFDKFSAAMDLEIKKIAPALLQHRPTDDLPDYTKIAHYVKGPPTFIEFNQDFGDNLEAMIVPSSDSAAGEIIDALGYAYIRGALQHAGLSEIEKRGKRHVIWISGDYTRKNPGLVNYLDTINDGKGNLVMNTRGMGRLVALLLRDDMIDSAPGVAISGTDWTRPERLRMQELLYRASVSHPNTPFDPPFITRDIADPPFTVENNKLGNGPLGVDTGKIDHEREVQSEASVLRWTGDPNSVTSRTATAKSLEAKGLTGTVVICWQNFRGLYAGGSPKPLSEVVVNTVTSYLAA